MIKFGVLAEDGRILGSAMPITLTVRGHGAAKFSGTSTYAHTLWPKRLKFGVVTYEGGRVLRVSLSPYQGAGPRCSRIFGTFTYTHTV